ncbi:MAG: isochorismatase family protein [Trueperaceae bacterium]|nr:MAG: isochorismatase family protein [Trueperaceae bacterium]
MSVRRQRHPLTLLTKEVPALELTTADTCLLLQDLHAPFVDPKEGWLASKAKAKVLQREFDEYFETLRHIMPNVQKLLTEARRLGLTVVFSCFGYLPPEKPSPLQIATGWQWDLSGADGGFPAALEPLETERVFSKPGWGALGNPRFETFLQDYGIANLLVAGTMLDFGLRQTCYELADRGYHALVVADAVVALTAAAEEPARGNLAHGLTKFRTTAELLDLLERLRAEQAVVI